MYNSIMSTVKESFWNTYEHVGNVTETVGKPARFTGRLVRNFIAPIETYGIEQMGQMMEGVFLVMPITLIALGAVDAAISYNAPWYLTLTTPLLARMGLKAAYAIGETRDTWEGIEEKRHERIERKRGYRRW